MLWQGQPLRDQELKENFEWIRDYNANGIGGGHLTSPCCPFFVLLSHLLSVRIIHNMSDHRGRTHRIVIEPRSTRVRYDIVVHSSRGHMTG